jgi:alpha-L-rhamnosidase
MLDQNLKSKVVQLADASWIGGAGNAFCRHEFVLAERPRSATLMMASDPHSYAISHWQILPTEFKYEQWLVGGSFLKYRAFVNGDLVAVGPFRPIEDGVPVLQKYDVTAHLRKGVNALAVLSRGEQKGFALCLEIVNADGSRQQICSGPDWKQREANSFYRPVCWECQAIDQYFKGGVGPGEYHEHLDGLAYPQRWRHPGFDDTQWESASCAGWAVEECELCRTPPYRLTRLHPQSIKRLAAGNYLLDFGRAVFGAVELASPPGGGVIELRLAEELQPNGHARYQLRADVCYQERWTFANGSEPLSHMGSRMFRYAEVIGWRGAFKAEQICAIAINAPFELNRSSLQCSDPRLEMVWQFCKNSVAYATADVFTDCLSRERLAYEADAYVTMLTQFCTEGSFETARRTLAYLPQHPTWPCEWWQCYIPLFYEYLLHTGDYEFVQSHYAFLRDQTSFHRLMKDGLIRNCPREPVVDWPESCRDGYEFGKANAVVNAYAYWDLEILGRLAHFLNREPEVKPLSRIAAQLRAAFNRELFDESTGLYVDSVGSRHSSLHANMYALRFGLVPDERVGRCLEFVKSKGMACSVFTAQFLLETLFQFGEAQTAVALMTRDGERSWMEMLLNGATVTTECWLADNKRNMSWAHPWGSSPANVIVRHLFGLRPTAPGWSEYTFAPSPGGIERGHLSITTPRGLVKASFERRGDQYHPNIQPEFRAVSHEISTWVRRTGRRSRKPQLSS